MIQSQLEEGIIEPVDNDGSNKIYYIPHKPVVRENAESTKLRVVYDASAATNGVSLNSCLEPGPSLQNLLWSVILRERLQPIALCADLKQAFLQIRIKESDRDVLRFHWMKDRDPKQRTVYRFTRALFGLNQSPFLLQGTVGHHLEENNVCDKRTIEKIKRDIYVNDIISGEETMSKCHKLKGPAWLQHEQDWPKNIVIEESKVSKEEAAKLKTVLAAARSIPNIILKLLEKHSLWKFLRITSWIRRFIINLRGHKQSGPLTTDEIEQQMEHWVKSTQEQHVNDPDFNSDRERLNLRKNDARIYECHGRITGEFPIYLPTKSILAEKLVTDAHLQTLHGGVSLTMAKIREKWWVPRLRSTVKTLIRRCNGCKRFHAVAFPAPPPGKLPRERTTATTKCCRNRRRAE